MSIHVKRISLVVILLSLGVWFIARSEGPKPEGVARQQAVMQALGPAGLQPGANATNATADDVISYPPVTAVTINLADIPTRVLDGNSQYDRWLQGEIDLDEMESMISAVEMAALQDAAMKFTADANVQQMLSGPDLLAPVLGTTFDSLDINDCCGGSVNVPPDPEMAAGPNHLIAVVNVAFEIYNKSGTVLSGPTTFSSFFSALGGTNCTAGGPFDPNTLYDEEHDRFMIAADGDGNAYCVGVSATGDPTGAWHLYEFPANVGGAFFDYPHAGIGRDAIYMGGNMFNPSFTEARVWAFDKFAMYAGLPAASVTRSTGGDDTPQPINLHGYNQGTWPTSGPHYILTDRSFNGQTYALHAWNDPFGANTFTTLNVFNLPAVHGVTVGFPVNVVQSGGGTIQANDFRPLDFEYRNGRGWSAMTVSCNPGSGTVNCVQWAEIDLATATLMQTGVFASNGDHRFFPDVAANHCGDMAVGYTKSSASIFPSVWATGRESDDPLGTLQAEVEIKAGEINYIAFDGQPRRWGDYSGMTIDPDGLTFWYLGEYSKITGNANGRWGNYIASMTFPDCTIESPVIEVDPASLAGLQAAGTIMTHTLTISNVGELNLDWTIDDACDASNDIPWVAFLPAAGTTFSNTSSFVDVGFDATGLTTGVYTGTLCVNSNDPVTPLVEVPLELTVEVYGVEMPDQLADSGAPGSTVTYTLQITNTGNVTDTFDLAVSGEIWTTTLSESAVVLANDESATVTVTVAIPASAVDGAMDTAMVTATSQGNPDVSASTNLTTTAVIVVVYDVKMPDHLSDSGAAGTTITYTLQITNAGNVTDTFDLAVSDYTWTTTLSDNDITLAAGESSLITVTVLIPAGAAGGDTDMAMVTATSQGDPDVSASTHLTTTAVADTVYIYLPIILRP